MKVAAAADHPVRRREIFISYRREEANYLAAWLYDILTEKFGRSSIFLDIDCIAAGVDFWSVITRELQSCTVLVLIIGPHWLYDTRGTRRLDRAQDPVRLEIETAIEHGVRILPVLLDETLMPGAADLPPPIASITRLNAFHLRFVSALDDVPALVEAIDGLVAGMTEGSDDLTVRTVPDRSTAMPVDALSGAADERQRRRLLKQLQAVYSERMQQAASSAPVGLVPIELELAPESVFIAGDEFRTVPALGHTVLDRHLDFVDVFDYTCGLNGDGLLILGGPGAGKTTKLFELAMALAERAEADRRHPVPVYLSLSAWPAARRSLADWAAAQLAESYQVPDALARQLVNSGETMLLLDGLDEIPGKRAQRRCADEIDRFARFGRRIRVPTVVTARSEDYAALDVALQLSAGVALRPLDPEEVLAHIQAADQPNRQLVAQVLYRQPQLVDLCRSPLLLTMIDLPALAQGEVTVEPLREQPVGSADMPAVMSRLVASYVDRRLLLERQRTRTRRNRYATEHSQRYLRWIAMQMLHRGQAVFRPDRIQLGWLAHDAARHLVGRMPILAWGLILGTATIIGLRLGGQPPGAASVLVTVGIYVCFGVVAGSARGRSAFRRALAWLMFGGVVGAVAVLRDPTPSVGGAVLATVTTVCYFGFLGELGIRLLDSELRFAERLSFSWQAARSVLPGACGAGAAVGTLLSVSNGLEEGAGLVKAASRGVVFGLVVGLFFGLVLGVKAGVRNGPIPVRPRPFAALRRSALVGLTTGAASAVVVGAMFAASGLPEGPEVAWARATAWGLGLGALCALGAGLGAVVQYWLVRLLLWGERALPLGLVDWLEYAVALRLMYRSAGGYVFIHRTILDQVAADTGGNA